MPQGKGTYGSQVGRPSKKKKYQGGGSIDPFSTKNPDSVVVKQALEEAKNQSDVPTSNAMERNQTSPMGNEVGTGVYKEGGKVDVTDIVKDVKQLKSDERFFDAAIKKGGDKEMKLDAEGYRRWKKNYLGFAKERIGEKKKKVLKGKKKK